MFPVVVVEQFVLFTNPPSPGLHPLGKYSAHVSSSLCPTSARHPGPRPPPPPSSSRLAVTSHNPARAGGGQQLAPRPPPALHPTASRAVHSHPHLLFPPLLPIPPRVVSPSLRPTPLARCPRDRAGIRVGVGRYTPVLPSRRRPPALWPVLGRPPLTQPPLSQVPGPPPVPLLSAGDELLRQCLIHRPLNPRRSLGGGRFVNVSFPPPHPRGEWAGGAGKAGWVDNSREVRAYPSLSPFPSRFHLHTYSHPPGTGGGWCSLNAGNWLSLWSPVYFPPRLPPPSAAPPPPHAASRPGAAGKPAAKHCSHEISLDPSCGLGLPCLALPCPGSTWGSWSWKERLLGLPIQEPEEGTASPLTPLSSLPPPWHQIPSCGGLAWLPFWPGLWATPRSGHLSREG